jgi:Rap1a immunity proteins
MLRLLAAMIFLLCVNAHAQDYPPIDDGNSLLTNCSVIEKSLDDINAEQRLALATCLSYIDGFREGFLVGATMGEVEKPLLLCLPEHVTSGQTARVIIRFLQNHPERLHQPAATLTYEALNKAFPCK